MPEISRFSGYCDCDVLQRPQSATFHAKYGDLKAVIAIETGEVIEGRLSPRVLGLVQERREHNKNELKEDWLLARDRKPLKMIKPLEQKHVAKTAGSQIPG